MSTLGLNSTLNAPSVNVLPAQRSLVIADSKYRNRNIIKDENGELIQVESNTESPYNFQADFASAIVGKEIIYQKLYWNQPIFSHNDLSVELRFQINGDETKTYVVYAMPFIMYTAYDGNNPGIAFGTPQTWSYASMMELGFNGDVRELNTNLQLINQTQPNPGCLYDVDGFLITVNFRYNPAQGFSISFGPSINPDIPVYTILLLPCTYIANGHFVHGFGIYDDTFGNQGFIPRNNWTCAYFSDDTPNLLPFRYIVVRSPELTKDRRMISFQNANSNRFNNEMAIIALNPAYTGTYHLENIGDDSTVISKRDDYQPQTIRIIITDETGQNIICDSPLSNLLQTPIIVGESVKNSFLFGPRAGRGNVIFVNSLIFGVNIATILPYFPTVPVSINQSTVASPFGDINYYSPDYMIAPRVGSQKIMDTNFWTWYLSPLSVGQFQVNLAFQIIPIIVNPNGGPVSFPPIPDSYTFSGFSSNVIAEAPFSIFNTESNNPVKPIVSVFTWSPANNPNPTIAIDARVIAANFVAGGDQSQFGSVYVFICGYSYEKQDFILASNAITGLSFFPVLNTLSLYSSSPISLTMNPNYAGLTTPQKIAFYFVIQNSKYDNPTIPFTVGYAKVRVDFNTDIPVAVPKVKFANPNLVLGQTAYIPPPTEEDTIGSYEFGNPLAIAKCEDLIHEFILILDKN